MSEEVHHADVFHGIDGFATWDYRANDQDSIIYEDLCKNPYVTASRVSSCSHIIFCFPH